MNGLNILQKAACAAVWRALHERDDDKTGRGLTQRTPQREAEKAIADYVQCLPSEYLPKLVLPELNKHGPLQPGYSQRWSSQCLAGVQRDAAILAQQERRVSDNGFPPDSSSSADSTTAELLEFADDETIVP